MSAVKLLQELERIGITLEAVDGRLRYKPNSCVTPKMRERLKEHKYGIIRLLEGRCPEGAGFICPWCRGDRLIEASKGLWCDDCEELAWRATGVGMVRVDQEESRVNLVAPDPCSECGSLETSFSAKGSGAT